MKIVLATGIYPPDIGGPATYTRALAEELAKKGVEVTVVTYERVTLSPVPSTQLRTGCGRHAMSWFDRAHHDTIQWKVISVGRSGGPLIRWMRYAMALRKHGEDADVIYAFSSISCGIPLVLSLLRKPRRVLRLGGDFLWERYTDRGGMLGLREWYEQKFRYSTFAFAFMEWMLNRFDALVFSTRMQQGLYQRMYCRLPKNSVIDNAAHTHSLVNGYAPMAHRSHNPFRLLFVGRFVGFKNLFALLEAMSRLPGVTLTLVGDGPLRKQLITHVSQLKAPVQFLPPMHGDAKQQLFVEQDLLILPSLTEISPNVALEARAAGLPVLLTEETGLSSTLRQGMVVRPLCTSQQIVSAVHDVMERYADVTQEAIAPSFSRTWNTVTEEHLQLFARL